jgi:hypothetical protein
MSTTSMIEHNCEISNLIYRLEQLNGLRSQHSSFKKKKMTKSENIRMVALQLVKATDKIIEG